MPSKTRRRTSTCVPDSEYVYKALERDYLSVWAQYGWKKADGSALKNEDIWKKIYDLISGYSKGQLHFEWTKGHAGQEENECCDKLARAKAALYASVPKNKQIKEEMPIAEGVVPTLFDCIHKMDEKTLFEFMNSAWLRHCLFFTEEGKNRDWLSFTKSGIFPIT